MITGEESELLIRQSVRPLLKVYVISYLAFVMMVKVSDGYFVSRVVLFRGDISIFSLRIRFSISTSMP